MLTPCWPKNSECKDNVVSSQNISVQKYQKKPHLTKPSQGWKYITETTAVVVKFDERGSDLGNIASHWLIYVYPTIKIHFFYTTRHSRLDWQWYHKHTDSEYRTVL